jgi:hypothetical protein
MWWMFIMVAKTFSAQVVEGQLRYQEPLDAFEGQNVRVTVVGGPVAIEQPDGSNTEQEPEPPDWMDVEKDVYVKMPLNLEILKDVRVIEAGPGKPTIILPEDLPDE